jgi:hypothetical protein
MTSARRAGFVPAQPKDCRAGADDSFRPARYLESGEDAGDVVADGIGHGAKPLGDQAIADAGRDQSEHFAFARCQLGEGIVAVGGALR